MLALFAVPGACRSNVTTAVDIKEEQLSEESALLEELASVLGLPGPVDQRLEQARALVQGRLHELRTKIPSGYEPATGPSEDMSEGHVPHGLVGQSEAMQQVYRAIHQVSHSHATVLLRGESGTGKELAATAIHQLSPRARAPFVRLHCAALTESLLESELFGHERGAFTGATDTRKGRFEMADGGTLFLDELGDIPPATQIKLLRVLQEKCIERVGGSGRAIQVDVRLISATHRDLEAMVQSGEFREDLYYRLNVVPIWLPPLRERIGDIPLLIEHLLIRFNRENHREIRLGRDLLSLMTRYHWPGNVRELQNCVERLVVMAEGNLVTLETVPASLRAYFSDMRQVTTDLRAAKHRVGGQPLHASLRDIERDRLREALERTGWVQARAARLLGLTPRQVAYKMRKHGIREGKG
jgi:Nif-specific regulatory protein